MVKLKQFDSLRKDISIYLFFLVSLRKGERIPHPIFIQPLASQGLIIQNTFCFVQGTYHLLGWKDRQGQDEVNPFLPVFGSGARRASSILEANIRLDLGRAPSLKIKGGRVVPNHCGLFSVSPSSFSLAFFLELRATPSSSSSSQPCPLLA